MIHLALGRLEVDWGKNNFFQNHGVLFQSEDCKPVPSYYAGEDWPDGEPIIEMNKGFGKPLRHIVDRLELLGHTLPALERYYNELHLQHDIEEQPVSFARLAQALREVDVNNVSGNYGEDHSPGRFVREEIVDRLSLTTELDHTNLRPDHWEVDLILENFSPYGGLRLLAENSNNLDLDVNWDFTPLVESGWASDEEFEAGPSNDQCFLIVTEGSSDAKVIKHALGLLRPHVADFFQFVDMEEGYPFSGTGNLYRFTQGLVSIAIQNNTIIVYDNDAEGVAKLKATQALSLPPNLRTMQLPQLSVFSNFPTYGPTGSSSLDINGKAAAIECYLDLRQPGLPKPVIRWTSFNRELGVYQGELEQKTDFLKCFLKLKSIPTDYDTTKIEAVLDALIDECVTIAEERNLPRQPD